MRLFHFSDSPDITIFKPRPLRVRVEIKSIWLTSFHASGIRLRNAQDWGKPGWTHSKPGRQMSV
ncbi:hypothetical protein CWM52_22200 [Raoultella sp. T31]|nr:hypothetical protein CWM52_22200 [Raoultella sp. T31]